MGGRGGGPAVPGPSQSMGVEVSRPPARLTRATAAGGRLGGPPGRGRTAGAATPAVESLRRHFNRSQDLQQPQQQQPQGRAVLVAPGTDSVIRAGRLLLGSLTGGFAGPPGNGFGIGTYILSALEAEAAAAGRLVPPQHHHHHRLCSGGRHGSDLASGTCGGPRVAALAVTELCARSHA